MDKLPIEILLRIFQYLSKEEQIKVSEVSKRFREALFSPTLWTEHDKRVEVPASQMTSFRKFLKQTPWLKYLNLLVSEYEHIPSSTVHLKSVFKPLNNLECLTLQLNRCISSKTFFPTSLKHISLHDCETFEIDNFITDNILIRVADSCPQLEHIQIKSQYGYDKLYTHEGLTYLLKKVQGTLQTLIISEQYEDLNFFLADCPPNLTTLILEAKFEYYSYMENGLKLPNLENLQILALMDSSLEEWELHLILVNCSLKNLRFLYLYNCCPFVNEDFYTKFSKLPHLQVLFFEWGLSNHIDELVRLVKGCSSLKVLAWKNELGYSGKDMRELEKLKKESQVKIYLSQRPSDFLPHHEVTFFPSFPNEDFGCVDAFAQMFDNFFWPAIPDFFTCHAPTIKKLKDFLDTLTEK